MGVGAALVAALAPGTAAAASPCSGQVCLFDQNGTFVGSYRDVSSGFQSFSRYRSASAVNGFSDNAVYFLYASKKTSCIQPQRSASLAQPGYGAVVGIEIRPGGNCYPGGRIQ